MLEVLRGYSCLGLKDNFKERVCAIPLEIEALRLTRRPYLLIVFPGVHETILTFKGKFRVESTKGLAEVLEVIESGQTKNLSSPSKTSNEHFGHIVRKEHVGINEDKGFRFEFRAGENVGTGLLFKQVVHGFVPFQGVVFNVWEKVGHGPGQAGGLFSFAQVKDFTEVIRGKEGIEKFIDFFIHVVRGK